jgi:DNA-binding GntR family transcriptional regulator
VGAGDRLPSRAQIGQECGVGENVVRRAQELLISQGVLEGRAGSGTYVAEPRQRVRVVWLCSRSSAASVQQFGRHPNRAVFDVHEM